MSEHRDDERLSPEDARWIERLTRAYRPAAPTASERTAFVARLDARIAAGPRRSGVALAAIGAVAATAVALWWLPAATPVAPPATPQVAATPPEAVTPEEAFLALVEDESALDDSLPNDLAAIESLWLGG